MLCYFFTLFFYLTLSILLIWPTSSYQALQQQQHLTASLNSRVGQGYQPFLIYDQQANNVVSRNSNNNNKHHHQLGRQNSDTHHNQHQPNLASPLSSSSSNKQQSDALLVCPDGWQHHSTQCYKFFHQRHSWNRARAICERYGAQLALIHDYQQNNFTTQLASASLNSLSNSRTASTSSPLSSSQLASAASAGFAQQVANEFNQAKYTSLNKNKHHHHNQQQPQALYASDERSYWIGFRAIDRLETNTLESAANTFVSKYIGFWDYDEPRVSQGECVRATVRHEIGPSSGNSYKLIQSSGK